jgi:hypothetical protein
MVLRISISFHYDALDDVLASACLADSFRIETKSAGQTW